MPRFSSWRPRRSTAPGTRTSPTLATRISSCRRCSGRASRLSLRRSTHGSCIPSSRDLTMYRRILVAIENSPSDQAIVEHVRQLAAQTGAELHLVHVADGWVARNFDGLQLRESEE